MAAVLCPHCHQPVHHERAGVPLPPLKAEIFDLIKGAGDEGISSQSIAGSVYARRWQPQKPPAIVRVHIWQLNELLESTDVVIVGERVAQRGFLWTLGRRQVRRVA